MPAGRLTIGADGLLRGPADITWNDPMPTPNGTPGGFGTAYGGVIHTEVGYEHSVIDEFNNPAAQASAYFSIAVTGAIRQYGTLGHDWMAWTQCAGNPHYRGVEHEDQGNPANPMTDAQLTASAQVFEAMSAFDGWPLAATDNPDGGRGIIFHVDGGAAWGAHDCPGKIRMAQRPEIIARALAIRAGAPPAVVAHVTVGLDSLAELAAEHHITPAAIIRQTALSGTPPQNAAFGDYVNEVFRGQIPAGTHMPAGLTVYLPAA